MTLKPRCLIDATTIDDAWFQAIYNCFTLEERSDGTKIPKYSVMYKVDYGSYAGQFRLEIDRLWLEVSHPFANPRIPQMPAGCSLPPPTSEEGIERYLPKIMTADRHKNEEYTYGQRMWGPVAEMILKNPTHDAEDIEILVNETPILVGSEKRKVEVPYGITPVEIIVNKILSEGYNTNQACLAIGEPADILRDDPPCLRTVDFRVREDDHGTPYLHMFAYFRSWDVHQGLPENLNGLQILKETVAGLIGVEDGTLQVMSKGAHVYDFSWEIVEARTGQTGFSELLAGLKSIEGKRSIIKP